MSSNEELLRRGYDAFNRRDWDAFVEGLAEDVLLEQTSAVFDSRGRFQGRDGFMDSQRELAEAWDDLRYEPLEFHEDGDRVLVIVRFSARGHETGIPFESEIGHLFTIRDGQISKLTVLASRGEAMRAFDQRQR